MIKKSCPLEKEVMKGIREKKLMPELQNHAPECPVCKDVEIVFNWMDQYKKGTWKIDISKKDLPNAQTVWDGALARKRPDKKLVSKALRPLILPQVLSLGVFIAGIISLGIKGFLNIGNIFDSPAIYRVFPFFIILISMIFLSVFFCGLLFILEKRKNQSSSI